MASNPGQIETGNLKRLPDLQVLNYTGLDFKSIKAGVKSFITTNYPDVQNDFFESSAFVMLIDVLSYINDTLAFRADFLSNEAYLPTASTEKAIYNLLKLINYIPPGASPSTGTLKITLEDADPELLNGDVLKYDLLISDSSLPLAVQTSDEGGNPLSVEVFPSNTNRIGQVSMTGGVNKIGDVIYAAGIEGYTYSDTVTLPTSPGAGYTFQLTNARLIENDLTITVNGVMWTKTLNFAYENGATFVYEVRYNENGLYDIVFGDGIFGAIPPGSAFVEARYRAGGGEVGNVAVGIVNSTITIPSNGKTATVRIENTTSMTGGVDKEDLSFSKFIAPKNFATQLRAVTGEDYTVWALSYRDGTNGSIAKAITTLRPYLGSYCRNNGPYNITASNQNIYLRVNGVDVQLTLDTGTNLTAQQIVDNIQAQIDVFYAGDIQPDIESFTYPSYSYKVAGNSGFDVDEQIQITSDNNKFCIRYGLKSGGGTIYSVTLPVGTYTLAEIINLTNSQLDTGLNSGLVLFRADYSYFDSKFHFEVHSTSWINTALTYFQFEFIAGQSNNFYMPKNDSTPSESGFGFSIPQLSSSYLTLKPAIGFTYHTPDSSLEVMNGLTNAYTTLGFDYSTIISGNSNGLGRALPMAANYVDLYVLARISGGTVNIASDQLKLALKNFFQRVKVLTDKITVWNGLLKYISLDITIKAQSNTDIVLIQNLANSYLSEYMSGNYNEFGESFYISKIYELLEAINGVSHVDINDIEENGISQLTTGNKLIRNIDTKFNELWVKDVINVNVSYQ